MISNLTDYSNAASLGSRLRAKRLAPLRAMISQVYIDRGEVSILDVGGRRPYWQNLPEPLLRSRKVRVTLLNLPPESAGVDDGVFTFVQGDACDMSEYADGSFDIVHSNSVIEHVGNWENVKRFAGEVRRLAPYLFIQTPSYWFPIEPHFIKPFHHWLPRPWRVRMFMAFQMGQRGRAGSLDDAIRKVEDEPFLLDARMFRFLFPDCEIIRERFLGFTKSMIALRYAPMQRRHS